MARTDNSMFISTFLSQERRSCKPIRKQISKLLQFDWPRACGSPFGLEISKKLCGLICISRPPGGGGGGGGGGVGGGPLRGWEVLCAGNKYANFRTLFYISCH